MGGKSFPNTSPISADTIPYFPDMIERIMQAAFGRQRIWNTVGSARYAKTEIGDYDVAVQLDDIDWTLFKANVRDMGFDIKNITAHCFSVAVPTPHPFKPKTIHHQLDFNQSQNIDYSSVMFWSPMRSMYKSAHRNILLQALLNVLTTKEADLGKYILRTKEYIDMYDGLVFLVQTSRNAQRFTTVDRRVLMPSKNHKFIEVVKTFLPEAIWSDLDSFETVYRVINKKYFVRDTENEMMQKTMREAATIIQSAKLEMPHEIKCWVEFD